MEINEKRLLQNLEELGKIGENSGGGIDRAFGSEADIEARKWITEYWENVLQGTVYIDAIANLWLEHKNNSSNKAIVIGSHHDAVPDGGKYDGALGVLIATEVMETILESGIQMQHPLSLVSFTGEEPNPFNVSTLGSKVLSGRLKRKDLNLVNRLNGETLQFAIARAGGDISRTDEVEMNGTHIGAFLECHIEQGKRLEKAGRSLATVSCITGIYREMYTVYGVANHAGTTPMDQRSDSFLGAAALSLGLNEMARAFHRDDLVATVGYVNVEPNEANIISGKTQCIVDIRTYDAKMKEQFITQIGALVAKVEKEQNVSIQREVILDQKHMPMDKLVMKAVSDGINNIEETPPLLVSMAGHDAANMARFTRSGMLFVQSVDGKSHCKEEYTRPEDIVKAANAMLYAVLSLDKEKL